MSLHNLLLRYYSLYFVLGLDIILRLAYYLATLAPIHPFANAILLVHVNPILNSQRRHALSFRDTLLPNDEVSDHDTDYNNAECGTDTCAQRDREDIGRHGLGSWFDRAGCVGGCGLRRVERGGERWRRG
ncbi:hypothetical protein AA313_de0201578 [Arthrobotrys entomopaga]|nr:hypothetical protein AA313_de0201578 [Arthrobotrys entomopaga]